MSRRGSDAAIVYGKFGEEDGAECEEEKFGAVPEDQYWARCHDGC